MKLSAEDVKRLAELHGAHPFLRYTEYGGYYEDRRIRHLNPALVV